MSKINTYFMISGLVGLTALMSGCGAPKKNQDIRENPIYKQGFEDAKREYEEQKRKVEEEKAKLEKELKDISNKVQDELNKILKEHGIQEFKQNQYNFPDKNKNANKIIRYLNDGVLGVQGELLKMSHKDKCENEESLMTTRFIRYGDSNICSYNTQFEYSRITNKWKIVFERLYRKNVQSKIIFLGKGQELTSQDIESAYLVKFDGENELEVLVDGDKAEQYKILFEDIIYILQKEIEKEYDKIDIFAEPVPKEKEETKK